MTHDERERAEALLNQLDALARAYDHARAIVDYEFGLSTAPTERAKYLDAILSFAREEQARVWEEAKGLLEAQQCRNPFYGTALYKGEVIKFAEWIDKVAIMFGQFAKQLREEACAGVRADVQRPDGV